MVCTSCYIGRRTAAAANGADLFCDTCDSYTWFTVGAAVEPKKVVRAPKAMIRAPSHKVCGGCGELFQPKTVSQRTCDETCEPLMAQETKKAREHAEKMRAGVLE